MNFRLRCRGTGLQDVEVAALIRLADVLLEEGSPATLVAGWGRCPGRVSRSRSAIRERFHASSLASRSNSAPSFQPLATASTKFFNWASMSDNSRSILER